jgi:hypothetical protein
VLGAAAAGVFLRRGSAGSVMTAVTAAAVVFIAGLGAWASTAVERYKAPRAVVRALPGDTQTREVRIATAGWFQPSLVFYCGREVAEFKPDDEGQIVNFLRGPLESYLFLPAESWEALRPRMPAAAHLIARHYDLYQRHDIVVVANQ